MKKLLLVALVVLGACGTQTIVAPTKKAPAVAHKDDITECRSGYVIAYNEDGSPYCKQAD